MHSTRPNLTLLNVYSKQRNFHFIFSVSKSTSSKQERKKSVKQLNKIRGTESDLHDPDEKQMFPGARLQWGEASRTRVTKRRRTLAEPTERICSDESSELFDSLQAPALQPHNEAPFLGIQIQKHRRLHRDCLGTCSVLKPQPVSREVGVEDQREKRNSVVCWNRMEC